MRLRGSAVGEHDLGISAHLSPHLLDRAQHSAGRDLLECVQLGDLPGVGMVVIDGVVRVGRSRNTPPADRVAEVVG